MTPLPPAFYRSYRCYRYRNSRVDPASLSAAQRRAARQALVDGVTFLRVGKAAAVVSHYVGTTGCTVHIVRPYMSRERLTLAQRETALALVSPRLIAGMLNPKDSTYYQRLLTAWRTWASDTLDPIYPWVSLANVTPATRQKLLALVLPLPWNEDEQRRRTLALAQFDAAVAAGSVAPATE